MSSVKSRHEGVSLATAREEVDKLFQSHDLILNRNQIEVGTISWKRKLGICKYNCSLNGLKKFNQRITGTVEKVGTHSIVIDRQIRTKQDFLDTVRHELAHAEAYARYGTSQNHNSNWKKLL